MRYFKKENKTSFKPLIIIAILLFTVSLLFKNTIYRSFVSINLGSLYIDYLNLRADIVYAYNKNEINKTIVNISPNNYVKLQKERSKMSSNYILTGELWNSENQYYKTKIENSIGKSKAELKLFGMNPDHYRDPDGHSFRVKYDGSIGFGNKKVNFINPRSRDYNTDVLANVIFKQLSGGISLKYDVNKVVFNKKDYGYYLVEDFFDKYLIEGNQRRESVIFEIIGDSIHFNHIGDDDEFLFFSEEIENNLKNDYDNFLKLFDVEKLKGILLISLIINDSHPIGEINLHWIHNPVTGLFEPTFREGFTYPLENFDINNLTLSPLVKDLYLRYIKEDFYHYLSEKLPLVEKIIETNSEYLNFKNKMTGFYSQIDSREKIILSNISKILNSIKKTNFHNKKLKQTKVEIKKDTLIKDNWTIKNNETLIIHPGTKITLEDAYIKIFGGLQILGGIDNRINITCPITNPSTIFINSSKQIQMLNVDFYNFSNTKSPFKQPASITFYESDDVFISNSTFNNNLEGDDYLNFFRSKNVRIQRSKITNTYSDALDSDFSELTIKDCDFNNIGNDAIDGSGSYVKIENCNFISSQDKAVSAGENSEFVINNSFFENNEIAIVSKDNSSVISSDNILVNNTLDLAVFKKKKIYNHPSLSIINTNYKNYLIEKKSIIRGIEDLEYTSNVEEKLYGNLYGKSSKR